VPRVGDPNHDAAGNMTYDHRLTYVAKGGSVRIWFIKDALGRRITTQEYWRSPMAATRYLYSGQNIVAEYDDNGTRLRYYVYGATYVDERVVMHHEASQKNCVYLTKDLHTVGRAAWMQD